MAGDNLAVQVHDDVTVVGFTEQSMLDALTIESITDDLLALVDPGRPARAVIDLSNVHFLSSIGLSLLLKLRRRADSGGGEIVLAQVRSEVLRLFRITRLDKIFLTFGSVDEAIAHFGA